MKLFLYNQDAIVVINNISHCEQVPGPCSGPIKYELLREEPVFLKAPVVIPTGRQR